MVLDGRRKMEYSVVCTGRTSKLHTERFSPYINHTILKQIAVLKTSLYLLKSIKKKNHSVLEI